ncbi:hypothetical protein TSMEX_007330, partial [Taenia solium]
MNGCEKDGRHDITVSSDGCKDSIPSQEEHEEVNYDADDEGEEGSDEKEDTHSAVSVKNAPIGTLSNVVREVELASPPSRFIWCRTFAVVVCINDRV